MPNAPPCIFGDIGELVPPHLKDDFNNCKADLITTLPRCRALRKAWCVQHQCQCEVKQADITSAGSHCTDHSSFGRQQQFGGDKARFFFIWCASRRVLQDRCAHAC
eukprot:2751495-Alexandrium_andersonii.AAC.1